MTNRNRKLSLSRQADLLWVSLYHEPRSICEDELRLVRRIDELHMEYPFAGSRMMKGLLRQEGFTAWRLHVATCMTRMGIQALYRRPNTSKPAPGHNVYPYLLRKLAVTRPNQVWAMDMTYIPLSADFTCKIVCRAKGLAHLNPSSPFPVPALPGGKNRSGFCT